MTTAVNIEASLRALPLFGELSDDLLQLVSAEVQTRLLPAGATIFRLGGIEPCVADGFVAQRASPRKRRRSWWRFLDPRRLIDPAGIVRVAMRAIDVGAREHILDNLTLADVCVQPALGAYSTTDLTKLSEIVAAGEAAAEQALPAILRSIRHAGGPTPR